MSVWLPPLLGVALAAHSLVYTVLFKPWRAKRLAYFLLRHWSWYRRWHIRWFFVRPMRQLARAFGQALAPAMRKAAESMAALGASLDTPELRAALAEAESRG